MSITWSSQIIADVRCAGVNIQPGIGIVLLRFSVLFDVKARQDQTLRFADARIQVLAGTSASSQQVLGIALPEAAVMIATAPNTSSTAFLFDLPLTPSQMAALEEIRNGGDLQFRLHVYGEAYGPQGPWVAADDIQYRVEQSEWIRHLNQASLADTLLFEVALPRNQSNPEMATALAHLKQARDFFLAGHYDAAIGKCRSAIDAYTKANGDGPQIQAAIEAFKSKKSAMPQAQRMLLLREAVRHMTHQAHHDPADGDAYEFSRTDANLILGMTAALLSRGVSPKDEAS